MALGSTTMTARRSSLVACGVFILVSAAAWSQAAPMPDAELITALRQGGHVLVMRHASSPRAAPDKAAANADNVLLERQLDESGRSSATAMGKAWRELGIPVGVVLSSPTYRARETIRLAQLATPELHAELGDGGQSMSGVSATQGDWLRQKAAQLPKGTNEVIVTHLPNISVAFPQYATDLADGETLVFGSDGHGGVGLQSRVKIEHWAVLAQMMRHD
jgi:phosphohistidine phosphatase SixA